MIRVRCPYCGNLWPENQIVCWDGVRGCQALLGEEAQTVSSSPLPKEDDGISPSESWSISMSPSASWEPTIEDQPEEETASLSKSYSYSPSSPPETWQERQIGEIKNFRDLIKTWWNLRTYWGMKRKDFKKMGFWKLKKRR